MGGLPALHSTYYVICLARELRILLYPIYTGLASAPNFPEKALGLAVNCMIQQGSVCIYSALKFARFLLYSMCQTGHTCVDAAISLFFLIFADASTEFDTISDLIP